VTTDVDIDPRMVCRACGWDVGVAGYVVHRDTLACGELVDYLCDDATHMVAVLESLTTGRLQIDVMWVSGSGWRALCASGHFADGAFCGYDHIACAPTPHEAVYALATKIGRAMEHAS